MFRLVSSFSYKCLIAISSPFNHFHNFVKKLLAIFMWVSFLFPFLVLGMEPRESPVLGRCSATEPYSPSPYGLYLNSFSLFHYSGSILLPTPHCPSYYSFITRLKVKSCKSSNFILFQNCFSYYCFIAFLYTFNVHFRVSLYSWRYGGTELPSTKPWVLSNIN
jgi:hypothetical protein